jgi:hypothetical protein
MKITFIADEIKYLAETIHGELPLKICIPEYQPEIKAQIMMLPKGKTYLITIEEREAE